MCSKKVVKRASVKQSHGIYARPKGAVVLACSQLPPPLVAKVSKYATPITSTPHYGAIANLCRQPLVRAAPSVSMVSTMTVMANKTKAILIVKTFVRQVTPERVSKENKVF